jgi:hypothetical protein
MPIAPHRRPDAAQLTAITPNIGVGNMNQPVPSQLGPAMPVNGAASQVESIESRYPHLIRDYSRPDFRAGHSALTPNEVYESILRGCVPCGEIDRTVHDAASIARQAAREAMADARPAAADAAAGERLERLERLVKRQAATIEQLTAKVAELQASVDAVASYSGGGT